MISVPWPPCLTNEGVRTVYLTRYSVSNLRFYKEKYRLRNIVRNWPGKSDAATIFRQTEVIEETWIFERRLLTLRITPEEEDDPQHVCTCSIFLVAAKLRWEITFRLVPNCSEIVEKLFWEPIFFRIPSNVFENVKFGVQVE